MAAGMNSPCRQPQRDGSGGKDRLSNLPVGVLGDILSFLPIKEAARAAALSRSWRLAFAGVDTISFVQREAHDNHDYSFVGDSKEKRSMNGDFMDKVNTALLSRSRCGNDAAPRVFRVNFGCYDQWDEAMLNRWLYNVLNRCTQELHLDLRLQRVDFRDHHVKEPCSNDDEEHDADTNADADSDADTGVQPDDKCPTGSQYAADYYSLPLRLFTCLHIRTLCLGACSLEPPELIDLPFLETLFLSTIRSTGNNIQRLISACPRLIELTLERCGYTDRHYIDPLPDKNFTITVLDKHLRRFALRCCHNLVRASIDASELMTLEYRGDVPSESILTLHGGPHKITSCTITFCGKKVYKRELPQLRNFLERFTCTKQLRLLSTHLGSQVESKIFTGFPFYPSLVRLELTGHVGGRSVDAVTRIFEHAPCVEILSLFMKPLEEGRFCNVWSVHELADEPTVPDVSIPCLRNRVREINLVHYQGHEAQSYVAKLLLCNAMVLERLCVVFPSGMREVQVRLKTQIEGWVVNTSTTEMIFL